MSAWRVALLEQARSDFLAADVLAFEEGHASQTTMLLQMAWEKLSKAALVMSGAWDPTKKSHKVVLAWRPGGSLPIACDPRMVFLARPIVVE